MCLFRKAPELDKSSTNKHTTNLVFDLNNKEELEIFSHSCPPFDAVISCLGSRTGGIRDSWSSEYLANLNILRIALKRSARKFVLLSAICVQKPKLHFQHAKLAMENELIHSGMTYTIIRPTAFFKSLAGQVDRVKSGKKFITFDNGETTSCKPISERDLAEYICSSLTNPKQENKVLPIGGPSPAITPIAQGNLLFNLTGKEPKFLKVPSHLFKVLQATLTPLSYFSSSFRDRIEFLKIAHYYATESMLVWDHKKKQYSAEKTTEVGHDTIEGFYRSVIDDDLNLVKEKEQKLF